MTLLFGLKEADANDVWLLVKLCVVLITVLGDTQ